MGALNDFSGQHARASWAPRVISRPCACAWWMRSTGKPAAATTINSASTPQTAAALNTVNISFGIDMADLLIERDEIVICSKKLLIYSSFKQE